MDVEIVVGMFEGWWNGRCSLCMAVLLGGETLDGVRSCTAFVSHWSTRVAGCVVSLVMDSPSGQFTSREYCRLDSTSQVVDPKSFVVSMRVGSVKVKLVVVHCIFTCFFWAQKPVIRA
jgi:hypothetical protein